MFFLIFACVLVLIYIFELLRNRSNYWYHRNVPSPPCHWLIGHLGGMQSGLTLNEIFYKYYRQYSGLQLPFVGLHVFGFPAVFITNSQFAKRVLTNEFTHFQDRGLYHSLEDLSSNLITLDYKKSKDLRRYLSPTFTTSKLISMLPKFKKVAELLLDVLDNDLNDSESIIDVRNLMQRFTFDVIGACAFGIETQSLHNANNEFSKITNKKCLGEGNNQLAKILILHFSNVARFFRLQYMPRHLIDFYTKFVNEIVTSREHLQIHKNDFMDLLINMKTNDGTHMAPKEMYSHALLFFQAGYETTAFTLTYILYELARHCDVQQKARVEIYRLMRDYNNELTYECLNQMKYVRQIIKGK